MSSNKDCPKLCKMGRPYIVHFMGQWESSHSSGFGPRVFPLTLFEKSMSYILQGLQVPHNLNQSTTERLQSAGEYWNILHSTHTQIHNKHNMCMNTSTPIHVHMHMHIYTYTRVRARAHVYMCIYACACVHVLVCSCSCTCCVCCVFVCVCCAKCSSTLLHFVISLLCSDSGCEEPATPAECKTLIFQIKSRERP